MVQAVNYIASKSSGKKISKLKLLKLLWLSDRYHLMCYGRTIVKDKYYALPHGPIASKTKNIIEKKEKTPYILQYIEAIDNRNIQSKNETDLSFFSESDIEVMDAIWKEFGRYSAYALRDLSHEYPEWKRFKELIEKDDTQYSYLMEMVDFFEIPKPSTSNNYKFFKKISEDRIFESKQIFELRKKLERF